MEHSITTNMIDAVTLRQFESLLHLKEIDIAFVADFSLLWANVSQTALPVLPAISSTPNPTFIFYQNTMLSFRFYDKLLEIPKKFIR